MSAFKDATSSNAANIHFNAGAITWGTTPAYLTDTIAGSATSTPAYTPTTVDTTLRPDLASLERAFTAAKSMEPGGVTYYGAPFTWFEHELRARGAAAQESTYQSDRQLNFVIFLTDGLANDYKPDKSGKDMPFSGDYSRPLEYAGDFGDQFCARRGWTKDKNEASTCSATNVIREVKNIPGTTVVGIYVGNREGYGPQVLHNVSSCDEYAFDPLDPLACPNTFSTDSFSR